MPAARRLALKELAEAAVADPNLFRPLERSKKPSPGFAVSAGSASGQRSTSRFALCARPMLFPPRMSGCFAARNESMAQAHGASLLTRSESWRPWRAYAAQHLWAAAAANISESGSTHV